MDNFIRKSTVGIVLAGLVGSICAAPTEPMTRLEKSLVPKYAPGTKRPFTFKRGDATLTIGGRLKVENMFKDNCYMLNKNIPDENDFFKELIDLNFDADFGQIKYGHKAAEFYIDLRHKSVWGYALTFADKDSGPIGPSNLTLNKKIDTVFGAHSHTSGKTLIYFKDAWLQFSLNAAFGSKDTDYLQMLKLGWFPFGLGREIALGGFYGYNKELLGLFSYSDDKSAPGIDLNGVIIKDRLSYDLYYSRFEEHGKTLWDTLTLDKRYVVGRSATPWRGVAKDDDLFAARLKWKALKDSWIGNLEFEPFVFYNAASDQKVEFPPDAKSQWGSYGLGFEYEFKNFEFGAEAAFNYGKQKMYNIDRNRPNINNRDGSLVEIYTKILDGDPALATSKPVLLTPAAKAAANLPIIGDGTSQNGKQITGTTYYNATDRFRPAYDNRLDGWMTVVDGAYNFQDWNLKVAFAYGYASGDFNPHDEEKNKTYHGFVGLHELYSGKRVKSILILDERSLRRPVMAAPGWQVTESDDDMFFSDLQLAGIGLTWTPKTFIRDLSINPNIVAFWKAKEVNKFVPVNDPRDAFYPGYVDPVNKARSYMGTEVNLLLQCSVIKDLKFYANICAFFPGGFFSDVKGVPLKGDFFELIPQTVRDTDPSMFRLSNDPAYLVNVLFDFKF